MKGDPGWEISKYILVLMWNNILHVRGCSYCDQLRSPAAARRIRMYHHKRKENITCDHYTKAEIVESTIIVSASFFFQQQIPQSPVRTQSYAAYGTLGLRMHCNPAVD